MTTAESSKRAAGELSANIAYLEPSVTMAISQEAQRRKNAGEDIIDLSAGEPDFPTPKTASEAG
ncbi:MAG: hypothetical protein IH877_01225, partial [Gemmatimonadetes bacterium]|nr:hypothetical protein [Gemmatimonadota bacterium]